MTGEEIAFEIECAVEHYFNSHLCKRLGCICVVPTPAMSAEGCLAAACFVGRAVAAACFAGRAVAGSLEVEEAAGQAEVLLWWEIVKQFSAKAGISSGRELGAWKSA